MQDDVVYSEVVFIRKEECKQENPNSEVSDVGSKSCYEMKNCKADDRQPQHGASDAKSDSRASLHCALLMLLTLCVLLLGVVTALTLLYITERKSEESSVLQTTQRKLPTASEDSEDRQKIISDNTSNCYQACPKDWEYHGGKCYLFSEDSLNWTRSRDDCISVGGHLAIINSQDEQEFLMNLLKSKVKNSYVKFWIGLTDEQIESQWLWVDNTLLEEKNKFWARNEPDNWTKESSAGEDCACMVTSNYFKGWSDNACAMPHRRICETKSPNQVRDSIALDY